MLHFLINTRFNRSVLLPRILPNKSVSGSQLSKIVDIFIFYSCQPYRYVARNLLVVTLNVYVLIVDQVSQVQVEATARRKCSMLLILGVISLNWHRTDISHSYDKGSMVEQYYTTYMNKKNPNRIINKTATWRFLIEVQLTLNNDKTKLQTYTCDTFQCLYFLCSRHKVLTNTGSQILEDVSFILSIRRAKHERKQTEH